MDDASERIRASLQLAADSRRLFRRADGDGVSPGLEPHMLQVLLALSLEPDQSTRTIARELQLEQGTVALAITELVNRRLIAQRRSESDGRRRTRSLTEAGKATVNTFAQTVQLPQQG